MQRRRPAERASARAADHLIERERVGVGAHLVSRLVDRHVADVGLHRQVRLDRADDVVDALVAFVVRVVDAGGVRIRDQPRVEIGEIAIVDERPVVVAVADDTNEAVARRLEDFADHPVAAAVDDAGPDDDRPEVFAGGVEHHLLVRRPERGERDRVDRRVLGRRLRCFAEDPHTRRVDDEALVGAGAAGGARPPGRRDQDLERRLFDRRAAAGAGVVGGVHVAVLRVDAAAERVRLFEVANHRMGAALGNAPRLFVVADERRHVVSAAHQRVEHGRADVAGRARQKDPHRGGYHSSLVVRDTLIDFFADLSLARGEFLVHDDGFRSKSFSYAEVARAARGCAAALHDRGIRKGETVVFWSENRAEWIVAFWACLLRGIVVVPIDYRASPDFLARVSQIVAAKLILIGQDVPPLRAAVTAPIVKLHEIEWRDGDAPPVTIAKDDVAEIIFTSGATAEPKGVVITHRNVLANIVPVEREVVKYRKWGKPFFPLRFLNLLPLSHMFGQAMATFIPPMLPGTVVFMRGYNPGEIVDQIRKRRVSVIVSVPKILDVLKDHVTRAYGARGFQPSGTHFTRRWWRYRAIHRAFGFKFWAFVVGAAPLDAELEAFWREIGFVVIQGYGLTETAPIVTLNHPFSTKKGSVGKAIAGVEVK